MRRAVQGFGVGALLLGLVLAGSGCDDQEAARSLVYVSRIAESATEQNSYGQAFLSDLMSDECTVFDGEIFWNRHRIFHHDIFDFDFHNQVKQLVNIQGGCIRCRCLFQVTIRQDTDKTIPGHNRQQFNVFLFHYSNGFRVFRI